MLQTRSPKFLLGLPLAALICFTGAWTSSAATPTQDPAPPERNGERPDRSAPSEHGDDEHSELERGMKVLQRSMKSMRPMLGDFEANQAEIIRVLAGMESSLVRALSLQAPRPEQKMNDSEWAQYQVQFRQGITASLVVVLEMELAAHKGEADSVVANYRVLNEKKKEGHSVFKLED